MKMHLPDIFKRKSDTKKEELDHILDVLRNGKARREADLLKLLHDAAVLKRDMVFETPSSSESDRIYAPKAVLYFSNEDYVLTGPQSTFLYAAVYLGLDQLTAREIYPELISALGKTYSCIDPETLR